MAFWSRAPTWISRAGNLAAAESPGADLARRYVPEVDPLTAEMSTYSGRCLRRLNMVPFFGGLDPASLCRNRFLAAPSWISR